MTTSGTFSFTVNSTQIITEAMLNIGAIGDMEAPTASEYTDCLRKLNMIVKQWMGKQDFAPGLKMWTRRRIDLFLGADEYTYALGPNGDNCAAGVTGLNYPNLYNQTQTTTIQVAGATSIQVQSVANVNVGDYLGIQYAPSGSNVGSDLFWTTVGSVGTNTINFPNAITGGVASSAYVFNYTTKAQRPLFVVTAILRDIYSNDTPMNFMTVEDYEQLPTKTSPTNTSDPTAIYYEAQIGTNVPLGSGQLYIDCGGAQDVTKHLHLVVLYPVQDFANPGDSADYPQQWYLALTWELSKQICPMFDCVWTEDMHQNWISALAMAREADAETTSFYFQPEASSPYDP